MKKKWIAAAMCICFSGMMLCAGCASSDSEKKNDGVSSEIQTGQKKVLDNTEVSLFAAASLNTVMEELIEKYNETQPNVKIIGNYDSSGKLLTQIEEGADCDIFFSAAQKQMDQLDKEDHMVVDGTRYNVVNNQLCVVTYRNSGTKVTGLSDLSKASSLALADGSVPAGKYTREAMVNAGMLPQTDDASSITTKEISDALGGIEINECGNVSAVTSAVSEGANEVGTVYYSDTYGLEDRLQILEVVPYDLTGDIIYPVAQVDNTQADDLEMQAAHDFIQFLISEDAKQIFDKYYFDTDVENQTE